MVGGATAVLALSRARVLALGLVAAGLVVYVAVAERLPNVSSRADVAVLALLVLPAFMSLVWLVLPFWRLPFTYLLFGGMGLVLVWIVLDAAGLDSLADLVKLTSFALLGFWLLTLFEELWWVALVAALIPWIDAWSVATGPTKYVTHEQPGFFEHVSVAFPVTGEQASINVGPPDVIFFALFLAAAARFRLRPGWTWLAMTSCLSLTIVLVWWLVHSGLPALPAVAIGFLVPNADLVWRHVRETRRARRELESAE